MELPVSPDTLYSDLKSKIARLEKYKKDPKNGQSNLHHDRFLAEQVIEAAYNFRHKQYNFTVKQLEELDPLVECCVDSLDSCIDYHSTSFDVDHGPYYLILRSGIQFMIEDFESLGLEYEDEDSEFKSNLTYFTGHIESWKTRFGHFDFFNYITHPPDELRRPKEIPADHTWWFEPEFMC